LAFIIVSAGQMTDSRMRTIGVAPLVFCASTIAVLLMAGCLALGYALAQSRDTTTTAHASTHRAFDFRRPEGRVLLDRVGDLSGRLTRLEIEAADLARRLGITAQTSTSEPVSFAAEKPAREDPAQDHRGGPWLPLGDNDKISAAAAAAPAGDFGNNLSHLEAEIARLDESIARMSGVAADRDLTTMAYPNRLPVLGKSPRISSGFGVRSDPFTGRLARHMGLDIPAAHGTPILASGGGRVVSAGFRGPYGKAIVIDHGNGLQTLYGHCSKLFVRAGDLVMPRQKIAAVGSTGRSTGPHLHFEVIRDGKRVEPGRVLASVLARNGD
jgi:murein DD-endopeptidase MepM/ murein hydrolase activator NlpD